MSKNAAANAVNPARDFLAGKVAEINTNAAEATDGKDKINVYTDALIYLDGAKDAFTALNATEASDLVAKVQTNVDAKLKAVEADVELAAVLGG